MTHAGGRDGGRGGASKNERELMRLKNLRMSALVLALLAFAAAAGAGTADASTVHNPAVQGPIEGGIRGYPWNHSLFPLSGRGYSYTENEYFFSGTATNLAKGVSAPYESRMLVRLPTSPRKFNGTVIVEWVNVTGQKDIQTLWPLDGEYLMRHGYGYVVVDAQLAGVCCGPTTLKGCDPDRYPPLVHPGDEFAYDIFSHAIRSLRHPSENPAPRLGGASGVDPTRGLTIKHV